MNKVVLIGYMGSGKSIIAKNLANELQVLHLELDKMIEKKCEMTIEALFFERGELYFRKIEHQLLSECINANSSFVLSTGGGTPCYYNNHEMLKNTNCVSIYLKASVDTLFNRLVNQMKQRPLIANLNKEELKEFIAKHLFDRSYYYNQAKYVVNVDNKNIEEIVSEIKNILA